MFNREKNDEKRVHRHKIELVTLKDVSGFVSAVSKYNSEVYLTDGNRLCVSAKSLLGAMASVEWNSLYCESNEDIYTIIQEYCVEEKNE